MKLGMLMRDTEYRDAMIEMLSEFDKDIFIEIADADGGGRDAVILTDIRPEEIERDILMRLIRKTVFLTPAKPEQEAIESDRKAGIHRVFKYSSLPEIMSEISVVYSEWSGDAGCSWTAARIIGVCGETDLGSPERSRELARQIVYRCAGSVLVIPLASINTYVSECDDNCFARLMYMVINSRDFPQEAFTSSDQYGISYIRMPEGLNPVYELGREHLGMLIRSMGSRFDCLVLDAGTGYRKENIDILRRCDRIVWSGSGRIISDPSIILGNVPGGRLRMISAGSDASLEADDIVRELYGTDRE